MRSVKYVLRLLVVLCALAFIGGQELARQQRTVHVSAVAVDPRVCVANGPVVAAWRAADEPGVYHVRCGSGVVLVAPGR